MLQIIHLDYRIDTLTPIRFVCALALLVAGCAPAAPRTVPLPLPGSQRAISLIPLPTSVQLDLNQAFVVDTTVSIYIDVAADNAVAEIAAYTAVMLAPAIKPGVNRAPAEAAMPAKVIHLRVDPSNAVAGQEGYDLTVGATGVMIVARTAAGLFYGVQTMRQMLPVSVEHPAAFMRKLSLPFGHVADSPRFEWRGMMLDVSRHFLPPAGVKRFVDLMSLYKLNRLHLHLSDDQGWRIEILSRPNLAKIGGTTAVGGGSGGFFTQGEYRDIVAYAASRFITVIPEIDMPAHTNAALASYPELNCDTISPPLYTGIAVGFSALCVDSARIYPILEDVVREISAITPGPYFHIGGDEVKKLNRTQYRQFIERMQGVVSANGKRMIGWGEIAPANISPTAIVQSWIKDSAAVHVARGGKVIMSPGSKLYLDMKYDSSTILGLRWAGLVPLKTTYDWDPATYAVGVPESAVLGVEAPLWSETLVKLQDFEYMAFPRLLAVAELGWTRHDLKGWDAFKRRLDTQAPRLSALGVNYPKWW